jgi:hypothetical protein
MIKSASYLGGLLLLGGVVSLWLGVDHRIAWGCVAAGAVLFILGWKHFR